MDQQGNGQPPGPSPPMSAGAQIVGLPASSGQMTQHQLAYQHIHQQQQQLLQQQLQSFWGNQYQEIEHINDFKNHSLPLARIKKIMKVDEDVRMISAEAPAVSARACEMFILELTLRAWNHTEENKRRTLQKNDIAAAITRTDIFDFLVDIVPREDLKDEVLASSIPRGTSLLEALGTIIICLCNLLHKLELQGCIWGSLLIKLFMASIPVLIWLSQSGPSNSNLHQILKHLGHQINVGHQMVV
ncbi:nuclear transcription factor Y subunit C-2-like isoform X2 [Solanum verrucosum]|uniref:nuclear transcription factor Y subunit C-2-like isoform X2 n=1 Tax=Solanum verrucosum TaxID=315347 RepID=UPI0020CFF649|nr:nuclear transcription factor Y subunit C-2-like isoform X2 [Solanum verrucosum]